MYVKYSVYFICTEVFGSSAKVLLNAIMFYKCLPNVQVTKRPNLKECQILELTIVGLIYTVILSDRCWRQLLNMQKLGYNWVDWYYNLSIEIVLMMPSFYFVFLLCSFIFVVLQVREDTDWSTTYLNLSFQYQTKLSKLH